jgi:acetyl esterase/lipase
MKHLFTLLFLHLSYFAFAQCVGPRYQTEIFDEVTVTSDIAYGSNTNIYNLNEELKLDVYEPSGDLATGRALIIFAHGGSFVFGDKADAAMVQIGTDFAKMGYVTASINYRLGLTPNLLTDLPDSVDAYAAIIRGVHDMKAAIRWFKKDVFEGDNQFNIDPYKILIAGFSAGGFIVLHQAYLDEESEWPTFDSSVLGVDGGIEGNSGNEGYSTDFVGGLSLAGALGDTSWIQPGDEPMMSTHGTEDEVVPYGTDTISFSLGFVTINLSVVDGSSSVHERLDNVGVPNCFTSYEGQGHVPESGLGAYYDTTYVKARNFFYSLFCQDVINCEYEELITGIDDLTKASQLKVYPNPFTDHLYFESAEQMQIGSIELYNLNGQRLQKIDGNAITELDLAELSKGLYILRIYDLDQGWLSLKITKQ